MLTNFDFVGSQLPYLLLAIDMQLCNDVENFLMRMIIVQFRG